MLHVPPVFLEWPAQLHRRLPHALTGEFKRLEQPVRSDLPVLLGVVVWPSYSAWTGDYYFCLFRCSDDWLYARICIDLEQRVETGVTLVFSTSTRGSKGDEVHVAKNTPDELDC